MATLTPQPSTPPVPITPVGEYIPRELVQVRALAKILDSAVTVPGTNFKIGLDAVIGLIPGIGDVIGMLIGSYIITTAARLGVPKPVLARMLLNVGTDAVAGAVPLVGDVLDAAWRANSKNAVLLEKAIADPRRTGRSSTWVVIGMVAAVIGITVAGLALAVLLVRMLWNAFS